MGDLTEFLLARIAERRLFWEVVGESRQAHPQQVDRNIAEYDSLVRIVERLTGEVATQPEYCACFSCLTLLDLAQPYSAHPNYDPTWRTD